jgi:hypothetical protein
MCVSVPEFEILLQEKGNPELYAKQLPERIPQKDMSFRTSQTMLIPYKNLDLGEKSDYLASITIAPNLHMNLSVKAVRILLNKFSFNKEGAFDSAISQNIQRIKILQSKIPYRSW